MNGTISVATAKLFWGETNVSRSRDLGRWRHLKLRIADGAKGLRLAEMPDVPEHLYRYGIGDARESLNMWAAAESGRRPLLTLTLKSDQSKGGQHQKVDLRSDGDYHYVFIVYREETTRSFAMLAPKWQRRGVPAIGMWRCPRDCCCRHELRSLPEVRSSCPCCFSCGLNSAGTKPWLMFKKKQGILILKMEPWDLCPHAVRSTETRQQPSRMGSLSTHFMSRASDRPGTKKRQRAGILH